MAITADNAEDYYKNNIENEPELDWSDILCRVTGQIQ